MSMEDGYLGFLNFAELEKYINSACGKSLYGVLVNEIQYFRQSYPQKKTISRDVVVEFACLGELAHRLYMVSSVLASCLL